MVDYTEYVLPMVAVATYILCAILKPLMKDQTKYMPLVAAGIGVVLAFWMQDSVSFATFVSGLISGFGATGIDQAISIPVKSAASK